MKYFLILSCAFVTVYGVSEEFKRGIKLKLADAAALCVPKVGATSDDIAEIIARKTPSRQEGKCLISCLQKKFNLQGDDGRPHREGTMQLLEPIHDEDPELYTKLIQIAIKCGPEVNNSPTTDHCELAIEITTCAIREAKLIGIDDPFSI